MSISSERLRRRAAGPWRAPMRLALGAFAALLAALGFAAPVAAEAESSGRNLPPLARLRATEYEAALARTPKLYLVLDPVAKHLDIRARGMTLERVALSDLLLLEFEPLFSSSGAPALSAPALWKVEQGPGDTDRETIAPVELRPYSEEEEMVEPAAAVPAGAAPAQKKPDEVPIPTSYRVSIDNGWQLYVTADAPQSSLYRRFLASVRDGWSRLRGHEPQHPPLITFVVKPEDAARLHHLFRSGTEILVLP